MIPYEIKLKAIGKQIKVCKNCPLTYKNVMVTRIYLLNREVYLLSENNEVYVYT